jgi:intracellular sulfur oxidation DsrE/DsrF family protein
MTEGTMRKPQTALATGIAMMLALAGCAATGAAGPKANVGPDKVVYHVNDSGAQATNALRNIGNHLEVNPQARIVVVTHAQGVDFLMKDAKDRNGNPYDLRVEDLKERGIRFDVCEITLRNRKLTRSQFIPEATFVPSGVAEITRLQQREGYAYLRP